MTGNVGEGLQSAFSTRRSAIEPIMVSSEGPLRVSANEDAAPGTSIQAWHRPCSPSHGIWNRDALLCINKTTPSPSNVFRLVLPHILKARVALSHTYEYGTLTDDIRTTDIPNSHPTPGAYGRSTRSHIPPHSVRDKALRSFSVRPTARTDAPRGKHGPGPARCPDAHPHRSASAGVGAPFPSWNIV